MRTGAAILSASGVLAGSTVFMLVSAVHSSDRLIIAASVAALSSAVVIIMLISKRAPSTVPEELLSALKGRVRELNLKQGELERRCYAILNASPAAFFELDGEGLIVFLNHAAQRLVGGGEEEPLKSIGRPFAEFIPPEGRAGFERFFRDALNGKTVPPLEAPMLTGGVVSTVELTATAIRKETGPPRVEFYARDIAGVKKLRARLEEVQREAALASEELKEKISELEEFALMAVRRELKMKEIREILKKYRGDEAKGVTPEEAGDITGRKKDLKGA